MKNFKKYVSIVMILVMVVCVFSTSSTTNAASKGTVGVSIKTNGKSASYKKVKVLEEKQNAQLNVRWISGNKVKTVTKKAKYKTSNKKVISVTKKGKMTAKKPGTCTITVKYGGKTKKLKFTVVKKMDEHQHAWNPVIETKRGQAYGSVYHCACGWKIVRYHPSYPESMKLFEKYGYAYAKEHNLPVENAETYKMTGEPTISNQHSIDHILGKIPGDGNYWEEILYEEIEYVAYYECECGAEKDLDGNITE